MCARREGGREWECASGLQESGGFWTELGLNAAAPAPVDPSEGVTLMNLRPKDGTVSVCS